MSKTRTPGQVEGRGRVLVTGGAGFIGSHVVETLLARHWDVVVLDDLSTGLRFQVPALATFVHGDVLDTELVRRTLAGVDSVVHLAAVSSVARSLADPQGVYRTNTEGSLSVLEAARQAGTGTVLLASSAAVYAESIRPRSERSRLDPHSLYGASKQAAEQVAEVYRRLHGVRTASLRFFNVYGPRQRADVAGAGVLPAWLQCLRTGEPLEIYGTGTATRDYTHVLDVARAAADALEATRRGVLAGPINVATGRSVNLRVLARMLLQTSGRPIRVVYRPARPGDLRSSRADVRLARARFGFETRIALEDGVADMVHRGPQGPSVPQVRAQG